MDLHQTSGDPRPPFTLLLTPRLPRTCRLYVYHVPILIWPGGSKHFFFYMSFDYSINVSVTKVGNNRTVLVNSNEYFTVNDIG